ncbi:MAG: hypothetical protein SNJ74_11645 [Fimbriimonadaceae bacterium]
MTERASSKRRQRGYALVTTFGILTLLAVAAASYVERSTESMRTSARQTRDVQTTHLCEAGVQAVLRNLWRPFKIEQAFFSMEDNCAGATPSAPRAAVQGELDGVGRFSAGVIAFSMPAGDSFTRLVTVRSVGWQDMNGNGSLDADEPRKVVDVVAVFQLARSQVFDYTYFVNNYGWMKGFSPSNLIVNGDMRANGNFEFLDGSPTVNGSVYGALNEKLSPAAPGLINTAPVKWTTSTYAANANNTSTPFRERMRQAYNPVIHGARGTDEYEKWRDFIFDSDGGIVRNRPSGAVLADSTGLRSWNRTSTSTQPSYSVLDTRATDEVIMPDLSNLDYYRNLSQTYVNDKAQFGDGTPNPMYGQGAFLEVWDPTLNGGAGGYKRLTTNGVVDGSVVIIGTNERPIRIHGPVTVTHDAVIKGTVVGQGTIYTGRNVHIVGNIRYGSKDLTGAEVGTPDFRGSNPQEIDNKNEKRTFLGLAARGSAIMGDFTKFTSTTLQYMTPPFTKGRYDENGNWIPPFDANKVDYTGKKLYQSTVPNSVITGIAEGINQLDAILYTNFVGGGNIGVGGGGVAFNGTIISKDEAMVVWSLPMRMNYDNRIRERSVTRRPLIDIQLPRSPTLLRSTWQDRGFQWK